MAWSCAGRPTYARQSSRVSDPYDALTNRERKGLAVVAEGHTNAAIAGRLFYALRRGILGSEE